MLKNYFFPVWRFFVQTVKPPLHFGSDKIKVQGLFGVFLLTHLTCATAPLRHRIALKQHMKKASHRHFMPFRC